MTDNEAQNPSSTASSAWRRSRRRCWREKRDIYTEAKKADPDLNTKALRRVIAERRMPDREQIEAAMHNYRVALGMARERRGQRRDAAASRRPARRQQVGGASSCPA